MADDEPVTFDGLRDTLMPPGTDRTALWASLKNSVRTGGTIQPCRAPDISATPPEAIRKALPASPMPADPFAPADSASVAIAETYHGLIVAGVPVESVERIIGIWLASLPGDVSG